MKLFDGVNKYAYETLFGIVNIEPINEDGFKYFVLKMISDTAIKLPVKIAPGGIIAFRKFKTRTNALKYLKQLENQVHAEVKVLLELMA
jgi:hypothetical protein